MGSHGNGGSNEGLCYGFFAEAQGRFAAVATMCLFVECDGTATQRCPVLTLSCLTTACGGLAEKSEEGVCWGQSSLMGPSLTVPIGQGRLALGTWQGIYLNEHRNYGGQRRIVVTLQGQRRSDGRRYSAWQ